MSGDRCSCPYAENWPHRLNGIAPELQTPVRKWNLTLFMA